MREFATADELVAAIASQGALVYGTGFVARSFMDALAGTPANAAVAGFVVTDAPEDGTMCCGLPVFGADSLSSDEKRLVCIAVHESVVHDIEQTLAERGVEDAVWVYPHLPALLYGEPVVKAKPVRVADLLAAQDPRHYWIAVRALAALEFSGENSTGCSVYLKAQSMHCTPATAVKRLERFKELDASFRASGFDSRYPLLCDDELHVIDGLHRLALSWRWGIEEVACDIVRRSERFDRLIDDRNRLTPEVLAQAGLTPQEKAELEGVHARLWESARQGR